MGRGAVLVLLPLVAGAFLVRVLAVAFLRRRRPTAAAAVERWWLWLPIVAVLVAATVANPLIGLLVTALAAVVLTRASGVGSPFPRQLSCVRRHGRRCVTHATCLQLLLC